MTTVADVVVAGAGHNSLVTAAYLARAGLEVLVLEERPLVGGNTATEELTLPGILHDSCSTAHNLIQASPALEELRLVEDYGLEYLQPDPVVHVVFGDGESFTQWRDLDRTCAEFARFSTRDAEAYRRLIADYDEIKGVLGAGRFQPLGSGPSVEALLAEHPRGNRWVRIRALSAWDVVRHEFEDRHVQAFMLWMAYQNFQPVDSAGTGMNAYRLIYGRQMQSWSIPLGGSGVLTDALVRFIEDHGGAIVCNKRVVRLLLEDGRCVGVETEDGGRYLGEKGVVSTIHVKHLLGMAPREAWGENFVYGVETYDIGTPGTVAHYATTEAPRFALPGGGARSAASAGLVGWPEDVIRAGRDAREGRPLVDGAWILVATPSLVDPSRAPGDHHTVKFLVPQPWDPGGGPESWETLKHEVAAAHRSHLARVAPNMTEDVFIAELINSPVDVEAANEHMIHGTFHGGDRGLAWSGAQRPAPGWAAHRMPIPGLYQTGGSTHPGGSITGVPGRNAAVAMLTDLGRDPKEVMSSARRVRADSR